MTSYQTENEAEPRLRLAVGMPQGLIRKGSKSV
jgi:hypothetical protein